MRRFPLALHFTLCCASLWFGFTPRLVFGRVWTDSTGRTFEGDLVAVTAKVATVRRTSDGKSFEIKTEKLSKADQDFVTARLREAEKQAAKAPPGEIPPLPANGTVDEREKKRIEEVLANLKNDPVTTYLHLSQVLKRTEKPPQGDYKAWLEAACNAIEPQVEQLLRRDYDEAQRNRDVQARFFISIIANRVRTGIVDDLKAQVKAGKPTDILQPQDPNPIWKVVDVKGTVIKGSYQEQSGLETVSITSEGDRALLRVTANVENISKQSDPPYAPNALGGIFAHFMDKGKSGRLANSAFIFAITRDNVMVPCCHITDKCNTLRGVVWMPGKNKEPMAASGSWVKSGDKYDMDLIFSVPKDLDGLQLLIMGSALVPINIEK